MGILREKELEAQLERRDERILQIEAELTQLKTENAQLYIKARLGEPDKILASGGMISNAWVCSSCKKRHESTDEIRPPSPCGCGSIFFEKGKRASH